MIRLIPSGLLLTTGEDVVFVCNDWHTGPLASYLKNNYQPNGIYRNAKVYACSCHTNSNLHAHCILFRN